MHMKTNALNYIGKNVTVIIDRPLNSLHPGHRFRYLLNYGYIPQTLSGDGEELDAYVLGIDAPVETFTGKCIAIIRRTDDDDDKLIVVPENTDFTTAEIEKLTDFQEKWFKHIIIRQTDII